MIFCKTREDSNKNNQAPWLPASQNSQYPPHLCLDSAQQSNLKSAMHQPVRVSLLPPYLLLTEASLGL